MDVTYKLHIRGTYLETASFFCHFSISWTEVQLINNDNIVNNKVIAKPRQSIYIVFANT